MAREQGCKQCKDMGITKQDIKDYCPCPCKTCKKSSCNPKCKWYINERKANENWME